MVTRWIPDTDPDCVILLAGKKEVEAGEATERGEIMGWGAPRHGAQGVARSRHHNHPDKVLAENRNKNIAYGVIQEEFPGVGVHWTIDENTREIQWEVQENRLDENGNLPDLNRIRARLAQRVGPQVKVVGTLKDLGRGGSGQVESIQKREERRAKDGTYRPPTDPTRPIPEEMRKPAHPPVDNRRLR